MSDMLLSFGWGGGTQTYQLIGMKDSTIWSSSSCKISDANDVNIVNFAWCYVLFDTVKVHSVKCCCLAVGGGQISQLFDSLVRGARNINTNNAIVFGQPV